MHDFKLRLGIVFSLIISVLFSVTPAFAHKVSIFAWVEGDTVYTQSKFSRGKKVKGAPVIVFDLEGNNLLEGKTDDNGEFSFKIPKKTALKVVLKASMGHMAEWTIPLEEINLEALSKQGTSKSNIKNSHASSSKTAGISLDPDRPICARFTTGVSRTEIKKMIDESLEKKLSPIMKMIADSHGGGPRLTEIIGGIGYILGIVGIAMYFISRRKKN
jgi:nickel transport protein